MLVNALRWTRLVISTIAVFSSLFLSGALAATGDANSTNPSWKGQFGEEINTYKGELSYPVTDLRLNTRGGVGIAVVRTYSSALYRQTPSELDPSSATCGSPLSHVVSARNYSTDTYARSNTGFGPGWRFSFGKYYPGRYNTATFKTEYFPALERPDGSMEYAVLGLGGDRYVFADGSWVDTTNAFDTFSMTHLVHSLTGGVTLFEKFSGVSGLYRPITIYSGLVSDTSKDGKLSIEYVRLDMRFIDRITDHSGREVLFTYNTPSNQWVDNEEDVRITQIQFRNHKDSLVSISYTYDSSMMLESVTSPAGNTTTYTYTNEIANTHGEWTQSIGCGGFASIDCLADEELLESVTLPTGGTIEFDYEVWWEQFARWQFSNGNIEVGQCNSATVADEGLAWCEANPVACECTFNVADDSVLTNFLAHFGVRRRALIDTTGNTLSVTSFSRDYVKNSLGSPPHAPWQFNDLSTSGMLITTVISPNQDFMKYYYSQSQPNTSEGWPLDTTKSGFLMAIEQYSHKDPSEPLFSSTYQWAMASYGTSLYSDSVGYPYASHIEKLRGSWDWVVDNCTQTGGDCKLSTTLHTEYLGNDYSLTTTTLTDRAPHIDSANQDAITIRNQSFERFSLIAGRRVLDSVYTKKTDFHTAIPDEIKASVVKYYYDSTGACSKPDSIVTSSDATTNLFPAVSKQYFDYDEWGNTTRVVNTIGDTTFFTYDNLYHEFIIKRENDSLPAKSVSTFHKNGLLAKTVFLNGNWIRNNYDQYDRLVTMYSFPEDSDLTTFPHEFPSIRVQYPSPNVSLRREKVGASLPSGPYREIKSLVDGFGRTTLSQTRNPADPVVYYSETQYDSLSRVVRTSNVYTDSSATGNRLWSEVYFDKWGNVSKTTYPDGTFDKLERDELHFAVKIDRNGRKLKVNNDVNGRLLSIEIDTSPLESDTSSANAVWELQSTVNRVDVYGNIVEKTDAKGFKEIRRYRQFNQLAYISSVDKGERLFYADNMNRPRFYRDALGRWTYKKYDGLGRLIESGYFNDTSTTVAIADTTKVTDHSYPGTPNNITVTSTKRFDTYPSGWDPATSQYLAPYGLTDYGLYQSTEIWNPAERRLFYYDQKGRKVHEVIMISDSSGNPFDTLSVQYEYRWDGAIDRMIYPSGEVVQYDYDVLGRIKNIAGVSDTGQAFVYNHHGKMDEVRYANGGIQFNTFDSLGVLTKTLAMRPSASWDVLFFGRRYEWNKYSLTKEYAIDTLGNDIEQVGDYSYDHMNRLISASVGRPSYGYPTEVLTWEFDGNSNWSQSTKGANTTAFDYDTLSNKLNYKVEGTDTIFYNWNAKGELTSRDRTETVVLTNLSDKIDSLVYDHRGLLVKRITEYVNCDPDLGCPLMDTVVTRNYYNSAGQKVRQTLDYWVTDDACSRYCPKLPAHAGTYYVYASGQLIAQYNSVDKDGTPDGSRILCYNGPVGVMKTEYFSTPTDTLPYTKYLHHDYKGNLRARSTWNGNPSGSSNEYYPYGEILHLGNVAPTRRYYQGGESDLTGFIHMGARYYDPSIGRFLTPDPIDASTSAYTFASGNPVMFIDPSGLKAHDPVDIRPTSFIPPRVKNRWTIVATMGLFNSIETMRRTGALGKPSTMRGQTPVFRFVADHQMIVAQAQYAAANPPIPDIVPACPTCEPYIGTAAYMNAGSSEPDNNDQVGQAATTTQNGDGDAVANEGGNGSQDNGSEEERSETEWMEPGEFVPSEEIKDLMKDWEQSEGFAEEIYDASGSGITDPFEMIDPTIGWGHSVNTPEQLTYYAERKITEDEANALFTKDIAVAVKAVNDLISVPLMQRHIDALVSLTYNVGRGSPNKLLRPGLYRSNVRAYLNQGNYWKAGSQFVNYRWANNKELTGLRIRRLRETDIFMWGEY